MTSQSYLQKETEVLFYKYGLFASRHPVSMILFSAIMVFSCCYPLLNLPLPGSEPVAFFSPVDDGNMVNSQLKKQMGYSTKSVQVPKWYSAQHQVAYIQQYLFKVSLYPPKGDPNNVALLKAFVATAFDAVMKIKLYYNKTNPAFETCFQIKDTVIDKNQKLKKLFPENDCLLLSPALFWNNKKDYLMYDKDIFQTINQYEGKPIETSQSIKEILFGITSKQTGFTNFHSKKKNYFASYAITLVLEKYDRRLLKKIHEHLLETFSSSELINTVRCKNETDETFPHCKNKSHGITHVHFKPQLQWRDVIPLASTYFILGCYIYFSVRKINFVKSKIGMAFCAVVSVMASLMMAVGLCSLIGLTPAQNRGEVFPYLVCIIGLENILVITKSVVSTPLHMDVEKRIAHGLKREGYSITKNLLLELILISFGYFTLIPEIQEFCAFALVGILSDFFMHMMFFVTVLSIDIRRLDIAEGAYSFMESDIKECDKNAVLPGKSKKTIPSTFMSKTVTELDSINSLERGAPQIMLKIPKRLRVVFFFADTRMVQRGLMVSMVIWVACLVYSYPNQAGMLEKSTQYQSQKLPLTEIPINAMFYTGDIVWNTEDILSFQQLSFRHWPTLFAYYNITLAARFLSILPVYLIPMINQSDVLEIQSLCMDNDSLKTVSENTFEETNPQLPSVSYIGRYQMTGLDYYLTLLLGAVSGMLMVFLLNIMYRCICSREYANWRSHNNKKRTPDSGTHVSSVGESIPLILTGHSQNIEFVDTNEFHVFSTDITGNLRIWDYHSGECICNIDRCSADKIFFQEHQKSLADFHHKTEETTLAPSTVWSLTGCKHLVILGCNTGRIEIWDSVTANLRCYDDCSPGGVMGLAVEDCRLVAARLRGTLDFYQIEGKSVIPSALQHRGSFRAQCSFESDVLSLQLVYSISAHQQTITNLTVSMGRILTGSCDHTLKLFNVQDARCQFTLVGHTGPVTCASMDKGPPTGAVSGSTDGSVKLWDLLTGICLHTLDEHRDSVEEVQCSMTHVVSSGQDAKLCIWARRTGYLIQVIKQEAFADASLKMVGKSLCLSGGSGEVFLWDVRRGELLRRVKLMPNTLQTPVSNIVLVSELCVVCIVGRDMHIIKFPSVMEKND